MVWIHPARARAAALVVTIGSVLALSACNLDLTGATITPSVPVSSASASPSPSATQSPSPTVSPTETTGPIVGKPAGSPVTPEVFLATIDTNAGLLRVVADVPGIYEDGGTCTVTVKDKAVSISKQSVGAADATDTACGQFTFSLGDLPSGTANVTVHYESAGHTGTSPATQVAIP